MRISRQDLDWAAEQQIISAEQAQGLWDALTRRGKRASKFDFIHLAYYAGALIVLLSMVWFLAISWEPFGAGGILAISLVYAACFAVGGLLLWKKTEFKIPGGLLVSLAVSMTPLVVYAIQRMLGLWTGVDPGHYSGFHDYIRSGWFFMEVATVAACLVAVRFVRFPFLMAPLSFTLWYMSMDAAPLLFGASAAYSARSWISILFGASMSGAAYLIDTRRQDLQDFGFWLHLFGAATLFGGLVALPKSNAPQQLAMGVSFIGFTFLAGFFGRKAYLVFGSLGMVCYIISVYLSEILPHQTAQSLTSVILCGSAFALLSLITGYLLDMRQKVNSAFWMYLPGLIILSHAMYQWGQTGEVAQAGTAVVSILLMLAAILIQRKALMVFGALGLLSYLFRLAFTVFQHAPLFPIILAGIGIGIIFIGILCQRHKDGIRRYILSRLPSEFLNFLPQRDV